MFFNFFSGNIDFFPRVGKTYFGLFLHSTESIDQFAKMKCFLVQPYPSSTSRLYPSASIVRMN